MGLLLLLVAVGCSDLLHGGGSLGPIPQLWLCCSHARPDPGCLSILSCGDALCQLRLLCSASLQTLHGAQL